VVENTRKYIQQVNKLLI